MAERAFGGCGQSRRAKGARSPGGQSDQHRTRNLLRGKGRSGSDAEGGTGSWTTERSKGGGGTGTNGGTDEDDLYEGVVIIYYARRWHLQNGHVSGRGGVTLALGGNGGKGGVDAKDTAGIEKNQTPKKELN